MQLHQRFGQQWIPKQLVWNYSSLNAAISVVSTFFVGVFWIAVTKNNMSKLHVVTPGDVIGRDAERESILAFVDACERNVRGGTMYICGSPGVGKTLSVRNVLETWGSDHVRSKRSSLRGYSYINVIGLRDPCKVFSMIEDMLKGSLFVSKIRKAKGKTAEDSGETFAHVVDCVDSVVQSARDYCKEKTTCVLVVDEIDYLCPSLSAATRGGASKTSAAAKRQFELVSALFNLPRRLVGTNCALIIVGIANSIDLSTKLSAMSSNCRATRGREPLIDQTLIFRPYTASELKAIVNEVTNNALDPVAVEVCSRKVAALHGDCRKVIDLCKQAKSKKIRNEASSGSGGPDSAATVRDLMAVMETAYKSQGESSSTLRALPQQQLLVLVAACRHANKHPERTEFQITDLRTALATLVRELNIPAAAVGQMTSLMEHVMALSNSGLMSVKQPSGIKQRVGTWKLNAPPDILEETLKHTNRLIANALGVAMDDGFDDMDVKESKRSRLVDVRE
jgi:Cdc6-like AAA superfamily ATPase